MTPYEIELVLYYHTSHPSPWRCENELFYETNEKFSDMKLLDRNQSIPREFHPNDKLHAFAECICNTPLPELKWVDPRTQLIIPQAAWDTRRD